MGLWDSPLDTWPPDVTNPFGGPSGHPGVDLRALVPTPCYATRDGNAICATEVEGGNYVRIDHPDGSDSLCAHLSAFLIGNGQVTQGQLIGMTGATGDVTGPHLHFGIRIGGNWTDPIPLLTPYIPPAPPIPPTPEEHDMTPFAQARGADGKIYTVALSTTTLSPGPGIPAGNRIFLTRSVAGVYDQLFGQKNNGVLVLDGLAYSEPGIITDGDLVTVTTLDGSKRLGAQSFNTKTDKLLTGQGVPKNVGTAEYDGVVAEL